MFEILINMPNNYLFLASGLAITPSHFFPTQKTFAFMFTYSKIKKILNRKINACMNISRLEIA